MTHSSPRQLGICTLRSGTVLAVLAIALAIPACGSDSTEMPRDGGRKDATPCPDQCDDGKPCTVDTCDPVKGCQHAPATDGSSCADKTVCNGKETCQSGFCQPGTPLACDDGNPCTAESCDPVDGCKSTPAADGTACQGPSKCLAPGVCQSATCRPGPPLTCDDKNPCTSDSCNDAIGCVNAPVASGTPCADDDACNGAETCMAGQCRASALDCDDKNPCTADSCDRVAGCKNVLLAEGSSCSDNDVCNGVEVCRGGACKAGTALPCQGENPCINYFCDKTAGCKSAPLTDGTLCADGNACNGQEKCSAGACKPGTPPDCDDKNLCTTDICDTVVGCKNVGVVDGTVCSPADACVSASSCKTAQCIPGIKKNCADQNPCTSDSCDPATGCQHTALTGPSCADADRCNGDEICVAGGCPAATPPTCNDSNPCTADSCDPTIGCKTSNVADGVPCADGKACMGGQCGGVTPACTTAADCNDSNGCTADTCETGHCAHAALANGAACADGNACNGAETCQSGACTPGTTLSCDDGNSCTTDSCEAVDGCKHVALADATACTSPAICAGGSGTCAAGVCTPPTGVMVCADTNPCTTDVCDASNACVFMPAANGTACSDNNACNGAETCIGGACQAATALDCDDKNACTADACDPATGCGHTPVADNTTCEDGNMCTTGEKCQAGVCGAGTAKVCTANPGCTSTCEMTTGMCSAPVCSGGSCLTAGPGKVVDIRKKTPAGGSLTTDAAGNQYLVDSFAGAINLGGGNLTWTGGADIVIGSFDPANGHRWSKSFGADQSDQVATVAVIDGAGHLVVAGTFNGDLDFNIKDPSCTDPDGTGCTPNYPPLNSGTEATFVAGFDAATGEALWAMKANLGTGGSISGIAAQTVGGVNGVVLVGTSRTETANNLFGAAGTPCGTTVVPARGGPDLVVARLDTTNLVAALEGTAPKKATCLWQQRFGLLPTGTTAGEQIGKSAAVDGSGDVVVVGTYAASAFTFASTQTGFLPMPFDAGSVNIFVAKLAGATGQVSWANGYGDTTMPRIQDASAVAVDASGNPVFVGATEGAVNFGGDLLASTGMKQDVLAVKLTGAGAHSWSKRFGDASAGQKATAVLVDGSGNAVIGGSFQGTVDFGGGVKASAGADDAFIVTLKAADGTHVCSKTAGSAFPQFVTQIVSGGSAGGVRVRGLLRGTSTLNFGTEAATALTAPLPADDLHVFIQKISP